MPHLSPISWVFLYVTLWICLVTLFNWIEFYNPDVR